MIVSLFPTPLSNATTVNGVIVISGRGADNPRVFGLHPSPFTTRRFNVEVCSTSSCDRVLPAVLETLPGKMNKCLINIFLSLFFSSSV